MKSGPIPYFLRLRGRSESMSALLGHASTPPSASPRSRWSRSHVSHPTTYDIEVHIKRQVSIAVGSVGASRSYTIGKGSLRDVPPVYEPEGEETTVDYEGEIQIHPTVSVGGFDMGKLSIAVSVRRQQYQSQCLILGRRTSLYCLSRRRTLARQYSTSSFIHIQYA